MITGVGRTKESIAQLELASMQVSPQLAPDTTIPMMEVRLWVKGWYPPLPAAVM